MALHTFGRALSAFMGIIINHNLCNYERMDKNDAGNLKKIEITSEACT